MACPAIGANRDLAYVREAIFKTTPSTPFMKYLRTTGDSFKGTVETQESSELRKGRVTAAPTKGRSSSSGDISTEMSYRSFDDLLAALMFNKWAPNAELIYKDKDKDEDPATPNQLAVAGQKKLTLGNLAQSFTIMKLFSDKGLYRFYRGVMIGSFSLSVPLDGKVTSSFTLMGANNPRVLDYNDVTPITGGKAVVDAMAMTFDPETPHRTDQFNSFVGTLKTISAITNTGEDVGYATQLDLQITHNLNQDYAIFDMEAICVSPQRFGVTGTVTLYLIDGKYINSHIDWDTIKIVFVIEDPNGNQYQFRLGEVKLTDAPDSVGGPESITIAYPFTSFGENALDIIAIPSAAENRVLAPVLSVAPTGFSLETHPDYTDTMLNLMHPTGAPATYAPRYRNMSDGIWTAYTVPVVLASGAHTIEYMAQATGLADSVVCSQEIVVV